MNFKVQISFQHNMDFEIQGISLLVFLRFTAIYK